MQQQASTTAAVQELLLRADVQATSVPEALRQYEAALEALNTHIRALPAGSPPQVAAIEQFKALLTTAEALKQQAATAPAAAEYTWRQRQAQRLAEQAVAADAGGMSDTALSLYCKLLSCLNRCHALETAPAAQAAIMARFQAYLERAEQLRQLQGR